MFSFIKLQEIHFSYNNLDKPLFDTLSANFHPGWTSICGVNGAGKTTLFKIIKGDLKPSSGQCQIQGHLAYIEQKTNISETELEDFHYDYSNLAIQLRTSLEIKDDWFERFQTLSVGEKKRLQIAVALAKHPDILLVDEPSNHLDSFSKELLLKVFIRFRGIGLLISHDRVLLNELCTQTAFLESGNLTIYKLPYDPARKELEYERKNLLDQKDTLKKEQKKTRSAISFQNEKIDKGKNLLSKSKVSKNDHDAKNKINLAKLTGADLKDSRRKKTLSVKESRISEKIKDLHISKSHDLGVFFESKQKPFTLSYKSQTIDKDFLKIELPEIYLTTGDRVAIVGKNGVGKSTLLKSLITQTQKDYIYAPQDFTTDESKILVSEILDMDSDIRGKIFTLISCLGSNPKPLVRGSTPSPGLWQKLMIAKAIILKSPILFLDEPTNHMDLPAIETLEKALSLFCGILVFVSHDKDFINKVSTKKWQIDKKENRSKVTIL